MKKHLHSDFPLTYASIVIALPLLKHCFPSIVIENFPPNNLEILNQWLDSLD